MAVWPAARRRLVELTAALALVTLVSVPLATDAGEWLERRVPESPLVKAHAALGDTMLPWTIALAVVAAALLVRKLIADRAHRANAAVSAAGGPGTATAVPSRAGRRNASGPGGPAVSLILIVLAVVAAFGSLFTVYRIGDSGSRAAWTGQFSEQVQPAADGPASPPGG